MTGPRILICVLFIGLIVLAWPEEENLMMVQLSKSHGPSGLDLAGIAIILAGYIPLIIRVFTRFSYVQASIGRTFARSLVITAVVFLALIAVGLAIESELVLWSSVAVATGAQAILVYAAFRKEKFTH